MSLNKLPYRPNVGICLINAEGKIFCGRRIDMQDAAWQMPQGGIDAGEDPRDAALRELFEETGVRTDLVRYLGETPYWLCYDLPKELLGRFWGGRFRGQRQRWYLYRFEGEDSDINIESDHPEFCEWNWKTAAALLEMIVPFKQEIYRQVFATFANDLA